MSNDVLNYRQQRSQITRGISNNAIYAKCLSLLKQYEVQGRLLEYGAGSGNLVGELLSLGCFNEITGVDLLPRPKEVSALVEWIQCDLTEKLLLKDSSFDVVISTEVIEHLENPRAVAREWFRLLKPGGFLLMSTPNQESIRAYCCLIFGGHFAAFLGKSYPAHITALLRSDLHRIFTEVGFLPPEFYFTDQGGIPKTPFFTWQQLSFGLLKGRLWSDNILAVTSKPFHVK